MDRVYHWRYSEVPITIISNNCWGGDIYQALKLPYNTPFIGMFINAPFYINFLKRPEYYLQLKLHFVLKSKYENLMAKQGYPIGTLEDVEIHFLHYKSEEEAIDKWERRSKRMLKDHSSWFVKFDDRDNCTEDLVHDFHTLPYQNKISFTKSNFVEYENNIPLKHPDDLILLHTTYDIFDFVNWLNFSVVKNTSLNKLINYFFSYPKKF
jgi:uncharacterized protein (DUF1919 family)